MAKEDASANPETVFRAFEPAFFLEWPAWKRLEGILRANGGSYGLSGPRGAGKTWLMLRAIDWVEAGDGERHGIGLWYPSPSEYDSLAFLASLSDSLATRVERWYRRNERLRSRRLWGGIGIAVWALLGAAVALLVLPELVAPWAVLAHLAVGLATALVAYAAFAYWRARWPEHRLLREAVVVRERARYSATQRHATEVGAEGGRGLVTRAKRLTERELVERPATLSSLVTDFRALAGEAAAVAGGVVIAVDELDKMPDPVAVRALLRDIKAIFEVPGVHFLVSVSDEAAKDLSLGALAQRNEFNSSFYAVVRAQPATPSHCAELLEQRGNTPREVALVLAVLAGGNPREVVRLAELIGPVTTGQEAAMIVLRDEALALRREVVTDASIGDGPELGQSSRVGAYLALPDAAFERLDAFLGKFHDPLQDSLWNPEWGDEGFRARFEEPWRRLLVRLAVARELASAKSIVRQTELTAQLLDVVVATEQSSHVGKIVLEQQLRLDAQPAPERAVSLGESEPPMRELVRRYDWVRGRTPASAARTHDMDSIVREARRRALHAPPDREELQRWLTSRSAGERVVGLAAVQATADLAMFPHVLKLARQPLSPFEQFHALRALESLRPDLGDEQREEVARMLSSKDWRDLLGNDEDRLVLATRLQEGVASAPR